MTAKLSRGRGMETAAQKIRLKFIRSWNIFLLKLFLTLGTRMFGYVATSAPDGKQLKAIHFAVSPREFNISVRTFVELLDSPRSQ
jgi:hypothetical protein